MPPKIWAYPPFPFPNIHPSGTTPSSDREAANSETGGTGGTTTSDSGSTNQNTPQGHSDAMDTGNGEQENTLDDPRNLRRQRLTSKKSPEVNLLHDLVRRFLREQGLLAPSASKAKPLTAPQTPYQEIPTPVSKAELDAYLLRQPGSGPRLGYMPYSFESSSSHVWNQRAVQLLAQEFRKAVSQYRYQAAASGLKLPDDVSIEQVIKDKLSNRQSLLKTRTRAAYQEPHLTPTELEELLAERARQSQMRARRYERRRQLFVRRNEIIEEKVMVAPQEELERWRRIQEVFALLDDRDMSSDETETERSTEINKVTRRVRKHWINNQVSQVMRYVDRNYSRKNGNGLFKRGNTPLVRLWDAKKVNATCSPKANLPRNFYSEDIGPHALETLSPTDVVNFPAVPFVAASGGGASG